MWQEAVLPFHPHTTYARKERLVSSDFGSGFAGKLFEWRAPADSFYPQRNMVLRAVRNAAGFDIPYHQATWVELDSSGKNVVGIADRYAQRPRLLIPGREPHPWRQNDIAFVVERGLIRLPRAPSVTAGSKLRLAGAYRRRNRVITVKGDNVDSTLTKFPLLVAFTNDTEIGAYALPDGSDICFYAITDTDTPLPHEKVSFSISDGAASGAFFVQVPSISTSGTLLLMKYGPPALQGLENAASVWDSDYLWVSHMADKPGDSSKVAATVGMDGAKSGKQSQEIDSLVGKGQFFNALGAFDGCIACDPLTNVTAWTVEWLFATPGVGDSGPIAFSLNTGGTAYLSYGVETVDLILGLSQRSWNVDVLNEIEDTDYHYLVVSIPGGNDSDINNSRLELDGVAKDVSGTTTGAQDSLDQLYIGDSGESNTAMGEVGEFRLSKVQRSAAWTKFAAYNFLSSDNELTFGDGTDTSVGGVSKVASSGDRVCAVAEALPDDDATGMYVRIAGDDFGLV